MLIVGISVSSMQSFIEFGPHISHVYKQKHAGQTAAILNLWKNHNKREPMQLKGISASLLQSFIKFDPPIFPWNANK